MFNQQSGLDSFESLHTVSLNERSEGVILSPRLMKVNSDELAFFIPKSEPNKVWVSGWA